MSRRSQAAHYLNHVGRLAGDWPRTVGYYSGVGLAVAFELLAPELALIIAVVPFIKLLRRRGATKAEREVASVLEGMAKPVAGDVT